jgi:signal transduction histidine kinase
MESLQYGLREIRSPLIDSAEAMHQLRRQLDSVLDDVEDLCAPAAGPHVTSNAVRLSEEIGTTRATQGVHPVESARVAMEMFQVLLPVVAEELRKRGMGDAAAETAAIALHRSIMGRVGLGALSYANHLLQKMSSGHRDERHRLARELHDGLAHSIGVALQNLELHSIYAERDAELAEKKVALARQVLREALASVRQTAQELHDETLKGNDLETALRDYLSLHVPAGIEVSASVTGDIAAVADEVSDELYIVLREAIRNAVLHSAACSIRVSVRVGEDRVYATVEDDGHGFDVDRQLDSRVGIGLLSMRERVELLAGELTVTSTGGLGTTVSVVIPWARRLL